MRRHGMLFAVALPLVALVLVPAAGEQPAVDLPLAVPRQQVRPVAGGTTAATAAVSDTEALKQALLQVQGRQ